MKAALVTGANQGLGLALVERLAHLLGDAGVVYLSGRNMVRVSRASQHLRERGLRCEPLLLNVDDVESVERGMEFASDRCGGFDVVISNAAARIAPNVSDKLQIRQFVETNNLGTTRVLRAASNRLNMNARVVVVASGFGVLRQIAPHLHGRLDGPALTLDDIDTTMTAYCLAVERGAAEEEGWPTWINVASKVGQVAAMRVFARQQAHRASQNGWLINAVCPGLVDTAASRPWFDDMRSAASPAEAAIDVVWLATLPRGATTPYGELVQKRRVLSWT